MTTEHQTGRALDVALARAIGYTVERRGAGTNVISLRPMVIYQLHTPDGGNTAPLRLRISEDSAWDDVPPFSTDITAAFLVVAAMRARGWIVELDNRGSPDTPWGIWFVCLVDGTAKSARGAQLPEAICRAALRALEAEAAREGRDG